MTINTNQPTGPIRLVGTPARTPPAPPTTTTNQRAARVADSVDLQSLRLTNAPTKPASEIDPKPITAPTTQARQANQSKLVASVVQAETLPTQQAPTQQPQTQAPRPETTKKLSLQAAAAIRFYQSPADQAEAFTTARSLDIQA